MGGWGCLPSTSFSALSCLVWEWEHETPGLSAMYQRHHQKSIEQSGLKNEKNEEIFKEMSLKFTYKKNKPVKSQKSIYQNYRITV